MPRSDASLRVMPTRHTPMLAILLSACGPDAGPVAGAGTDPDVIDLRMDWPDPPEGGLQILTPDLEVGPYEEVLKCAYGAWDGPDMGVVSMVPLHPQQFHHHSLLKDAPPSDPNEAGELVDCGGPEDSGGMQKAPLFHAVLIDELQGDGDFLALPDGLAMRLPAGQRYSADLHYVNTTDKRLLVNSAFNLGLVPADQVERWMSSFEHDIGALDIPTGGAFSASFDCPVGDATSILSVSTHMHSYGTAYRIELVRADGSTQTLVDVPEWDPDYRYLPPRGDFQPGEVAVGPGDTLRTTCTWFNGTDQTLTFPTEMCTTSGVALDLEAPLYCEDGVVLDRETR